MYVEIIFLILINLLFIFLLHKLNMIVSPGLGPKGLALVSFHVIKKKHLGQPWAILFIKFFIVCIFVFNFCI